MRKFFMKFLAGGAGHALIGTYLGSYVLLQYSGFFGPRPGSIMRVLHQWPALAAVAGFVLYGLARGYTHRFAKEAPGHIRKNFTLTRFAYLGIMLCGAGILLSSLTRFEGRLALAEGQEVTLAMESFDAGTLYQRKFSKVPQGSLMVREIEQFLWKHPGMQVAKVRYRNAGSGASRELRIYPVLPGFVDGNTLTIKAAGYSPHVFLFDRSGDVIENFYAVLQLSPAGAEDSFRFDGIIPHTFYLRYYPDVSLLPDRPDASRIKSGPLFRVRIARNLDIVADTYAAPDETVFFDKLIFSAGDVRKWVEVQIVRDPGMYLIWPGLLLLICSSTAIVFRKPARKAEK